MTSKKISIEDVHVVVADNNQKSREIALKYLKEMGFRRVDIASDGAEGLSKIVEDTRLLIANICMPRVDGIALLQIVREAQDFERGIDKAITNSRKNLKLVFDARDSNRPFGVVHMIQKKNETGEVSWDNKDNGEWDLSNAPETDDNWQEPEGDERSENIIHVPDNLSAIMMAKVLRPDDLEKILVGCGEFRRKPINKTDFQFAIQKALLAASINEGVRAKYGAWARSLETSGRELIRYLGMEDKNFEFTYKTRHPNPLDEFKTDEGKNTEIQPFLNSNPNWTTDRSAHHISTRWKIVFASLIKANFEYCRMLYAQEHGIEDVDSIKDKILVCDLGLGSGRTLKGLRQKGIPEESLVAVANTLYFELQSMLESALLPDIKQEDDSALSQFLRYFSVEFLNQKGRGGLLDIQIGESAQEARLRRLLREVDVSEICQNKTLLLPGMFSQERKETLSDEVVQLFQEYQQDPRAFFEKYFQPALTDSSKGRLQRFVQTHGKYILSLDFRDIGEHLSKTQMLGPTYDCRSLSHLPDPGYHNTMLAVLTRLLPGAIYIGDGVMESYSWHMRGGELTELLEFFESEEGKKEYSGWWAGDDKGPLFLTCQRGVKDKNTEEYHFWDAEGDDQYSFGAYLRGAEMIPSNQFYKKWPKLALKDLLVREIRKRCWDEAAKEIVDPNDPTSVEYVRTWMSDKMRIPSKQAAKLPDWERSTEPGVRVFDYLDVFFKSTFESEEFQKHADEDNAAGIEKWMKREMDGKEQGWILKLADEFMELRDNIIAWQELEEEQCEKEAPESQEEEDPEEGTASATS
ncbi:hypothetical protein KKA33_01830 [Patescibacteria group bacterium]|nr:hypothetical protein [Patescibacteria group bacterium]